MFVLMYDPLLSVSEKTWRYMHLFSASKLQNSIVWSINQSNNHSLNHSITQSVSWSVSQTVIQSVSQTDSQIVSQSVSQSINQSHHLIDISRLWSTCTRSSFTCLLWYLLYTQEHFHQQNQQPSVSGSPSVPDMTPENHISKTIDRKPLYIIDSF